MPSLIYQLAHATNQRDVEFSSISTTATGELDAGRLVAAGGCRGFTQMPFTFIFNGSFVDLYRPVPAARRLHDQDDLRTAVNGRLLTLQSVKLAP